MDPALQELVGRRCSAPDLPCPPGGCCRDGASGLLGDARWHTPCARVAYLRKLAETDRRFRWNHPCTRTELGLDLVGIVAGASRAKWVDPVAMRIVDAIVAFPLIVLTLAIIAVAGQSWHLPFLPAGSAAIILSVVLVDWTVYARLARSHTLSLRDRDYVVAARTLGYSSARIVFRHLLPGVGRTTASYAVADAILIIIWTASLSFLAVGIQAPTADWGSMMFEGRAVMSDAWWITVIPGAMIVVTGLALTAIGDSLLEVDSR